MPDYALMNQYLYEGKAKEVEQMTKDALAEGRHFSEVLTEGLIAGMSVVGEDFKHNILYVPEVLIAARAMKAGMAVLKPLLSAKDSGTQARRHAADGHRPRRPARHRQEPRLHDGRGRGLRSPRHRRRPERRKVHGRRRQVQPDDHRHERAAHDDDDVHEDGDRRLRGGRPRTTSSSRSAARRSARCSPTRSAPTATARTRRPPSTCSCASPSGEDDAPRRPPAPRQAAPAATADADGDGKRSTYKVLYWQEIPSQIRVEDDAGNEVSIELPPKFTERIDAVAAQARVHRTATTTLAQWKWSDEAGARRLRAAKSPTASSKAANW